MTIPLQSPSPDSTQSSAVTVWYDSACPLCAREIAIMRRLDWLKRIAFIDLHDPAAVCPIDPRKLLERFHARDKTGTIVSGAAAFALMWRQIPILTPFGQLARIPLVLNILERAYCRFLPIRRRWLAKRRGDEK